MRAGRGVDETMTNRSADVTFALSGSDTTFILDEPVEPQHTLKVAVFDEESAGPSTSTVPSTRSPVPSTSCPRCSGGRGRCPSGSAARYGSPTPGSTSATTCVAPASRSRARKAQLCRRISEIDQRTGTARTGRPGSCGSSRDTKANKVVAALKMNHALADGGRLVDLLDLLSVPTRGAKPSAVPVPHAPEALTGVDALLASDRRTGASRSATPYRGACAPCGGPAAADAAPRPPSLVRGTTETAVARPADPGPILLAGCRSPSTTSRQSPTRCPEP